MSHAKPFSISKKIVWEAYERVKANQGAAGVDAESIAGEEIVAPAVETPPRVVNLMDALKKSLDAVCTTKKKLAKAAVA